MATWAETLDVSSRCVRAYLAEARAIRDELIGSDAATSVEYSPVTPVVMGIAAMLQREQLARLGLRGMEDDRG